MRCVLSLARVCPAWTSRIGSTRPNKSDKGCSARAGQFAVSQNEEDLVSWSPQWSYNWSSGWRGGLSTVASFSIFVILTEFVFDTVFVGQFLGARTQRQQNRHGEQRGEQSVHSQYVHQRQLPEQLRQQPDGRRWRQKRGGHGRGPHSHVQQLCHTCQTGKTQCVLLCQLYLSCNHVGSCLWVATWNLFDAFLTVLWHPFCWIMPGYLWINVTNDYNSDYQPTCCGQCVFHCVWKEVWIHFNVIRAWRRVI